MVEKEFVELFNLLNKDFDNSDVVNKKEETTRNDIDLSEHIIKKESVMKESINYELYLFKYNHSLPVELDDDYNVKPLKYTTLFEYGVIAHLDNENGNYYINLVF